MVAATADRACLYYKLTHEPKGSGELKSDYVFLQKSQLSILMGYSIKGPFKKVSQLTIKWDQISSMPVVGLGLVNLLSVTSWNTENQENLK